MYFPSSFSEHDSINEFKIGEITNNIIYPVGNQPYIIVLINVPIDGIGERFPVIMTAIAMHTMHQNNIWKIRFANDFILNFIPKYPDINIKQCVQTILRLLNSRFVIVFNKSILSGLQPCGTKFGENTPLWRVGT